MFENSKDNIKIIEWPELIKKPENRIDIFLIIQKNDLRNVKIIGSGKWKDYIFNEI